MSGANTNFHPGIYDRVYFHSIPVFVLLVFYVTHKYIYTRFKFPKRVQLNTLLYAQTCLDGVGH